jgi:hypothetical protein
MQSVQEQALPKVGSLAFDVYGAACHGRSLASQFKLRCDAIGLHEQEILLLSVVGPETSVRALTAGLRSSGKDQERVEYTAHVGAVHMPSLARCVDGYRVYHTKLAYGLWHVLCLAKRADFMPVMTEDAVWHHLQSASFTSPLLREWVPWLYKKMKANGLLVELNQSGCQAGLLLADSEAVDELVSEGLRKGHLAIAGPTATRRGREVAAIGADIQTLDQYMLTYGPMLGQQAERALQPLHVPGRDRYPSWELLREPFDAQAHVIEATRKALCRQKTLLLVGEMGTGKTIMGMGAVHAHARGRPYRALVVSRLLWPAALLISASVLPKARACEINVCLPWWIVSVRSRANPSTLHADRNRRRSAARCSGIPCRFACTEHTNGSVPRAPSFARLRFHATRSSNVPASHQSGTHRAFFPLVICLRSRRCGRCTSTTTSSSCKPAISETRRPQQHARRTMIRLRWTLAKRSAFAAKSARMVASSRRVKRRVGSRFQVDRAGMGALRQRGWGHATVT